MIIKTDRLVLRPWKEQDLEAFAKINADPRVMEYFPSVLTKEQSDAYAKRISHQFEENGWGVWAVSCPGVADFIGFIGLFVPTFTAHFTPAVEVGWRLAYDQWGRGYATEGAKAALEYGFETLNLAEIVSFTSTQNARSRAVMAKLGMHYDPKDDFDHPGRPETSGLKRHVLYRLKQSEWRESVAHESKFESMALSF